MARLLALLGDPHKSSWYSIHVAGTNGKGSVCAYMSSVFSEAHISNGRFTSPHLIDRWDSISINGRAVKESLFQEVEGVVRETDKSHSVGATEFEMLTVTAFEIFKRERVRVAVVEVGLGGRLDATNVLVANEDEGDNWGVITSVITKIGLDHQGFLGSTLSQIAKEKAGIIKPFIPVVVDGSNAPDVLKVATLTAENANSQIKLVVPQATRVPDESLIETNNFGVINSKISPLKGNYQSNNLGCAVTALSNVAQFFPELTRNQVLEGIRKTSWPGRLQTLNISLDDNRDIPVLLDGAHNDEAAEKLDEYINTTLRKTEETPVTFVVAFTQGKDFNSILKRVLKPQDIVITTEFGKVDGMPWISSHTAQEVADIAQTIVSSLVQQSSNVRDAVNLVDTTDQIVIFGSLYLASEVLRWQRH